MSSSLIIYSSTDGHTERICRRIVSFLSNEKKIKVVSLKEAEKINLSEFGEVIIGASIRYGKHSKELYKFIKVNKDILDQKKLFFSQLMWLQEKQKKVHLKPIPILKNF